ncbi:MAG: hypothetical protein AAFP02_15590, partial [Bacteroidota bacterium]
MVFLIFTTTNLYLGVNDRITEMLAFGEDPCLSLRDFHFPEELEAFFEKISTEVESYFDRTAFELPSNISVMGVYAPNLESGIQEEILSEFKHVLPPGWIWEMSVPMATDFLDSERRDELSISFRRLIKKVKNEHLVSDSNWRSESGNKVQVLERIEIVKEPSVRALPVSIKMPTLPSMPSLPSVQMPSISIPKPRLPEFSLPVISESRRRYLVMGSSIALIGIVGYLLWPSSKKDNTLASRNSIPVEVVSNNQPAPTANKVDATASVVDSIQAQEELKDSLLMADTEKVTEDPTSKPNKLLAVGSTPKAPATPKARIKGDSLKSQNQQDSREGETSGTNIASADPVKPDSTSQVNDPVVESTPKQETDLGELARYTNDAVFPGGQSGISRYLALNTKYPKTAKRKNVRGEVVVKFEVDVEGRVVGIQSQITANPTLSPRKNS